jgi:hypothetical protein
LIFLNVLLIKRMHFENIAWPIIAVAIPASTYLAVIDLNLYYQWFGISRGYLFSDRILIYKGMILAGLFLSLVRPPVVYLRLRPRKTDAERLGGKDRI